MGEEFFDDELVGMVNYSDDTVPQQMPVMERKAAPKAEPKAEPKREEKADGSAMDASFEILPKKKRGLIDKLYDMMKWLCVCGGIAMLLWWFWQKDLMAMEAAYPCILACGVIGSFGVGMNIHK